jgi:hypothetical protein
VPVDHTLASRVRGLSEPKLDASVLYRHEAGPSIWYNASSLALLMVECTRVNTIPNGGPNTSTMWSEHSKYTKCHNPCSLFVCTPY